MKIRPYVTNPYWHKEPLTYFLARASQTLPIGTAYAIWVGIGALGAAVFGVFLFDEPISPWRIFFLALLLGRVDSHRT